MSSPRFDEFPGHLAGLRAAALRAADPALAVQRCLGPADLPTAGQVFVVGAGKAGAAMARAAVEIVGARLAGGVLAVPQIPDPKTIPPGLRFIQGGHPLPDEGSLAAGRALARLLQQAQAGDLVLALISGGGSALLELPVPGVALDDLRAVNTLLLKSGAAIHEVNLIRKQLSQLKGGGLARLARPARVLALILSDVVGSPLEIIASGPTVPTGVTRPEALEVIDRHHLRPALPPAVRQFLEARTPQAPPGAVEVENRLVGSNRQAGEAAAEAARALGFAAEFLGDDWQGEAREVGARFAERLLGSDAPPRCLVAGGETTVTVLGAGRGGRNQEAALGAALRLAGRPGVVVSTFATDGVDGPTDAAGATVTGQSVDHARALGLDPEWHLRQNDAYPFFDRLGDLVRTGPTGTNVNDLLFGLAYA